MGIFKYSENFLNFWELCKCDEFTKCLMCSEKFWKRNSIINLMCSGCSGCILRVPRAKRIQSGTEPTRRREVRRGRFFFVVSRRFERIGRSRCRRRSATWAWRKCPSPPPRLQRRCRASLLPTFWWQSRFLWESQLGFFRSEQ